MFEPFPHADYLIHGVADIPIELNDRLICGPELQVDFRTAGSTQQSFCFFNNGPGMTAAAMLGRNRQVIQPATMAFVSGHDAGDYLTVEFAYQKQVGPNGELAPDILAWIIPRTNQIAALPQRNDCGLVWRLEWSNAHGPR